MVVFKVIRKVASRQLVAVTGETKNPRPWAGEELVWEGEARDEQDAIRRAEAEKG